jgi:membrane-bound lytic murein transglycosylase D
MRLPGMRLLLLVMAVGCVRSHPALPIPESPTLDDLAVPVVEVPGINEIALVTFEPAPFPDPAGVEIPSSKERAPAGLDLSGYDISMAVNERVQYWIDLFTGRERDRFALYLARQGQFEEMINQKLRDRGLPSELLYLALIESGFSPVARSRARAVGLWQFITGTARLEDLEVSEFVDERRHAERATTAALNHLEKLYAQFGSWYLAAAAYNSGSGRVERALARRAGGARGHDSLFWRIHAVLPAETRNYVPKLVAATVIARNRELFGFDGISPMRAPAVDTVTVPDATDLDVIAEAAGVTKEAVAELNPHFYRGVTPPRRSAQVLLPDGVADAFSVAFASIPPEKRVRFREHVVRRGETLSQIAARYGTTISVIQAANGIRRANRIQVGQRLRIPSSATRSTVSPQPVADRVVTYRVRIGDSIWSIARKQGVSPQDLMMWNSLTENSIIKPGDRLIIRPES